MNDKHKILAIDPATICGWAISTNIYGTWNLKTHKDETWGMKLLRMESKLKEIHNIYSMNIIVYERPGGRNTVAIITQSKIIGVIEKFCQERNIEYKGYSSKEIKKYATGNGNANKELMIEYAFKKLGYEGYDNNEADALWLLMLSKHDLNIN